MLTSILGHAELLNEDLPADSESRKSAEVIRQELLREAGNCWFHWLNVGYHVLALVGFALVSPWWLVGFAPALVRAVALRPGLRPAVIGAIESVMSLFFLIAAVLAG